jgi:hypothetical protein
MKTKIDISDISFVMQVVYYNFMKKVAADELQKIKTVDEFDKLEINSIIEKMTAISFKYQNLKDQIETYEISKTPLDLSIHPIDDFMIDVYRAYCDMEKLIHDAELYCQADEDDEEIGISDMIQYVQKGTKSIIKDYTKLRVIFNDIMLNAEFTENEIRGIQKNYLQYEMLNESVYVEDYEKSAIIRDKIKTI